MMKTPEKEISINQLIQGGLISLKDRLPPFDEHLRIIIYTEGADFAGEQFFDVKATDIYPAAHPEEQIYGDYKTEIAEAATHWMYHPKTTPSIAVIPGMAFMYTNSNALGLVHFVGVNPYTGSIVVTNSAAPDRHLRQVASFDILRRCPEHDLTPPEMFNGYLLKRPATTEPADGR